MAGWPTAAQPLTAPVSWPTTCGRPPPRRTDQLSTLPQRLRAELDAHSALDTLAATDVTPADGGLTQKALHRLDDGRLGRVGADALPGARLAPRARHGMHLEPGRLRGRLPVLRHRRAGLLARPGRCRDRRPGPLLAAVARRRRAAADQRRVHGHGRAAAQRGPGNGRGGRLTRSGAIRPGCAPHDHPTSGVVPGMDRLTKERPQYTLAVSLHAARPQLRDVLVPLNRRYPVGRGGRRRAIATPQRPAAA